ncbi:cadmium-translocating P-type ATPase [Halovulum dunhuangense]|uniref:Cadmium-translocating P-type ATPase n=1 Tax=Halovulum dunhuangense TaxID=1505036 RepID=A0A849KZD5_9RHOB|nr:heavy metal translocating P-type ATPase [Halovulum dunhuangense]NNU78964.1 cadmium-translocating P-type ATPase [Halovulum dunhuangense]
MSVAACPACVSLPDDAATPAQVAASLTRSLDYSVPSVHCAACIGTVERGLARLPGVVAARVNLTLKRVTVRVRDVGGIEQAVQDRLAALGHPGDLLDADTLGRAAGDPVGRALMLRLGVSGFAAMNVMLLSVSVWSGAEGATRDFLHWISAAIALPTVLYAGQPFFANAWAAIRRGRMVMDTPISVAMILALSISLYETAHGGRHAYFDAALSLTFFLLLGRVLDHRSRAAAKSAAVELAALEVPKAELLTNGTPRTVSLSELKAGDTILVRPGMRVPVDGTVARGATELDRSLLTGETAPAKAAPGDPVHAGETNLTGRLEVTVTAIGADTRLRQIAELVRAAEATKNRYVSLADRAARFYSPVVHILAFAAGSAWYATTGDLRLAVNIATATLIITCPCALGLAVPSVMVTASGALFRRGVLLKDGTALERLARVDTVILDKTGTLTAGRPALDSETDPQALSVAAALGASSAHPLAQALAAAARAQGIAPAEVCDIVETPGAGVEGRWGGAVVRLGRAAWVGAGESPDTTSWLRIGDDLLVPFRFTDHPRAGVGAMLDGLRGQVRDIRLLSGDAPGPVERLADRFGIETAEARLGPDEKHDRVARLQQDGHHVLMLGDGMNDTAALAAAEVSISPASGMDVARNAADIVLLNPDLSVVPGILRTARRARARIIENFALAALYNAIAIPIAVAGYATPLAAALAMSASSICVSLNALRVRGGI